MGIYRWRIGPLDVQLHLSSRPNNEAKQLAGGIELMAPPPVSTLARDPQRALDFLRDPALAGDGCTPNPKAQAYLEEASRRRAKATDFAGNVAGLSWYHTIELPGGIVTPGSHDRRPLVHHLGLADDLTGIRALDVATFDGFWAFELERRGAEVVALDLPRVADSDWPTGTRDILLREQLDVALGEGFAIAAAALGSKVRLHQGSVYDLAPEDVGTFDLVLVGDLLVHLEHPLRALRSIRSVTSGSLLLIDRYDPELSGDGRRLLRYEGGWRGLEWWAPSLETLAQWVIDAGFCNPDIRLTCRVPGYHKDRPGWDRAVIHAAAA